jgi:hypothetical protein
LKGIGIRLLLIAVIAGGAFVLRDRLSGHAGDLQVGDCFDVPTAMGVEVADIQHHPCNEPHTAEVILVRDHDADAYPSGAEWDAFVEEHCIPAFNAYTGLDYMSDQVMDIGSFTPTAEGWSQGDHEVTCHIMRIDGAPMNASVKASQ